MRRPWYSKWIEPPLPLRTLLSWPVLWVYGWLVERLHRPIIHTPLDVLEPEPSQATFRLWDKDYNLLATWQEDAKLFVTKDDSSGLRWSGVVNSIEVVARSVDG